MTAQKVDLRIDQGSTFSVVVAIKDSSGNTRSLVGYSSRMQGRSTVDSPTTLFDIAPEVDGINGIVTITIPFATTAAYSWTRGVYDMEIYNGSVVERIIEGNIFVSPEVTR